MKINSSCLKEKHNNEEYFKLPMHVTKSFLVTHGGWKVFWSHGKMTKGAQITFIV
jgi:hypothetical protein